MSTAPLVRRALASALTGLLALAGAATAQPRRPVAQLDPRPAPPTVAAGSTTRLVLRVTLPEGIHVQAHEPDDPLLIPTVATITAPVGVRLSGVKYPTPTRFAQAGRDTPLLALGPVFDVEADATVDASVAAASIEVPVVLRYQACDDRTCFPPARASAVWRIAVR